MLAPDKVAVPFADFVNAPLPANTMETDALLNTVALLVTFTVSAFEMAKLEPVKTSLPVEPERLPPLLEMDTTPFVTSKVPTFKVPPLTVSAALVLPKAAASPKVKVPPLTVVVPL